jgi:hypothetical protein
MVLGPAELTRRKKRKKRKTTKRMPTQPRVVAPPT